MPATRRILVTSALPYANGAIHIGHLVEYTQTDIWARFQKLRGHNCKYICADDTHGAAIMLRARAEQTNEEAIIAAAKASHLRDFKAMGIEFDHFGSTHSESNKRVCDEIWSKLRESERVVEKDVTQLFDKEQGTFLADRFVKGECPRCGAKDQYGDNCEKCGATYAATDLVNPFSVHSGAKPELRTAKHLFVRIESEHAFLDEWTQTPGTLQPEVSNYLKGFFLNKPLHDWDVSRPAPYFGFEIPDAKGHFWYVWYDAPIGYIASTKEWCDLHGESLADWWRSDETEIHHFIGKDIVYFHALFWPTMLKASGYSLPTHIQVHGFLTFNGEKMSKSRGTMIPAEIYLKHLDPIYLRYYYASKLGTGTEDLDLDIEDFVQKVNSDLVNKVVNLASRSAKFIKEAGLSEVYPDDGGLFERAALAGAEIAAAYEACDFAKAMRLIMALADRANEYVDEKAPWSLRKQPGKEQEVQDVSTVCLNLYRQLVIYLSPVTPQLTEKSAELLRSPLDRWNASQTPVYNQAIGTFKHLLQRVDAKLVNAMLAESLELAAAQTSDAQSTPSNFQDSDEALKAEPLADECTIDDFGKVDLRVARIIHAEPVKDARKLLKLTVSLGGDTTRTIFAGIKAAYEAETLVGRLVVVVANLKPRKMKFGLSEGMVIASGPGGKDVFVLSPDDGAKPGQRVH